MCIGGVFRFRGFGGRSGKFCFLFIFLEIGGEFNRWRGITGIRKGDSIIVIFI